MQKLIFILSVIIFFGSCQRSEKREVVSSKARKEIKDPISKNWIGEWSRLSEFSKANLETSQSDDSLYFHIFAVSGANDGEIEGNVFVKGNKAVYKAKDELQGDCELKFRLVGDSVIIIEQNGLCPAGLGVGYAGRYVNTKFKDKIKEEDATMISLKILKPNEDSALRATVGESYKLFVSSSQLVSENKDLDGVNAKVYASGVRGLFTFMENIIMVDKDLNIWAAVLDDEKVYYFTNNNKIEKLPKTVESWRERFEDKEVIFK